MGPQSADPPDPDPLTGGWRGRGVRGAGSSQVCRYIILLRERALNIHTGSVILLSVVLATVALLVTLNGLWVGHLRIRALDERLQSATSGHADVDRMAAIQRDQGLDIAAVQGDLERWHAELLIALKTGIEHVDRAESRVQSTLRSANKKFEAAGFEAPGVEAEMEGLQLLDAEGGGEGELPPLRPVLEDGAENRRSIVPGLSEAELQQLRGT